MAATDDPDRMLAGFVLSPAERFVTGVRFDGSTLTLRPSAPYRLLHWWAVLVAAVLVAFGAGALGDAGPGVAWQLPVAAFLLVYAVASLRSRVTARPQRLEVRGRWRTRAVAWSRVVAIDVVEARPPWWQLLALGAMRGTGSFEEATPVVVLPDGTTIPCTGLVTLARREGMSFGEPTAAEMKAGLLARYLSVRTGGAPTFVPPTGRTTSR